MAEKRPMFGDQNAAMPGNGRAAGFDGDAPYDTQVMSGNSDQVRRWELPPLVKPVAVERKPPTAQELEAVQTAAYEEGYARGESEGYGVGQAAGYEAGYASGVATAHAQAERLRELIDFLVQPIDAVDEEVERMMVALTIELARRLVNQQLELDPALTAAAVREALEALGGSPREARILLNPEDVELVGELISPPTQSMPWRIVADPELHRGDCRIITESGQVDALLDTRQAGLARALLGDSI